MRHFPSDSKTCMKVEESDPMKIAPPNKIPKKKAKEDKGKSIYIGEFTHIPTIPHAAYPFGLVGRNNRASCKDVVELQGFSFTLRKEGAEDFCSANYRDKIVTETNHHATFGLPHLVSQTWLLPTLRLGHVLAKP
ncbi:hypothetical protein PIB30_091683 [Stylosanthes scabra]|uniref:Uncharacterized protein n=1 Tax=Stylosanthes scabra TaxID=79078 RepID=A0ABU6RV00_9FABA|nr:hypothetical protein [Stylosanthes scabra]